MHGHMNIKKAVAVIPTPINSPLTQQNLCCPDQGQLNVLQIAVASFPKINVLHDPIDTSITLKVFHI
jgi:hypothetical protein